ncbi:MAG: TlpA family protein disulfide reductase [Nitrospirota bacterium]|nr:TlpA family protein disulfide reductase [Nitrospirota bacterium]
MIDRRAFTVCLPISILMASSPVQLIAGPPDAFVMHGEPLPLPAIDFENGLGEAESLSDFQGKVILLNLWATWCAPCRAEMPTLDNLQATLGGPHFEVLALSLDRGGAKDVEAFYRELDLRHLEVHVDPTAAVQRKLKALGLPTTLLIEMQGREVGRLLGPAEWDNPEMIAFLEMFIGYREDQPADVIEETRHFGTTAKIGS